MLLSEILVLRKVRQESIALPTSVGYVVRSCQHVKNGWLELLFIPNFVCISPS